MDPIPLILVRTIRPLLDFRARIGLIEAREPKLLRDDEALIPLAYAGKLLEATAQATNDAALGLHAVHGARIETIPVIAYLLEAWTLGEALERLVKRGPLFNSGEEFRLYARADRAFLERRNAPAVRRGRQLINDFALMVTIAFIRLGAGASWRPSEIWMEGPPPAHAEELAALAESAIHFGAKSTVLAFPHKLLDTPLRPKLRELPARGRALELPAGDFASSARQAVRSLLELGELELSRAAEAAGSSVRSFQRRLSESGLSFAHLVDQARFEAASRMLRDPAARIIDVSAELGYTDSANFTRAFRRWAGVPPAEFRRASREAVAGAR